MSVPTVWAKAKAEIQRRGWHQGDYGANDKSPDSCPVCILGAVDDVLTGSPWGTQPLPGMEGQFEPTHARLIRCVKARGFSAIGPWNDAPDRTVEDVYALLDELDAAERAS